MDGADPEPLPRAWLAAALALVALLIVVAVLIGRDESDTDETEPLPPSTSSTTSPPPTGDEGQPFQRAVPFFEAVAGAEELGGLTRPGSLAERFATHVEALGQVGARPLLEVSVDAEGIELCSPGCRRYGDVVLDAQGRVSSFTVDGETLDARLVAGQGPPLVRGGVGVALVSAYAAPGADLVVLVELSSIRNVGAEAALWSAAYDPPDGGGRVDVAEVAGQGRLVNGPRLAALSFPGVSVGGTLHLDVFIDGLSVPTRFELEVI